MVSLHGMELFRTDKHTLQIHISSTYAVDSYIMPVFHHFAEK